MTCAVGSRIECITIADALKEFVFCSGGNMGERGQRPHTVIQAGGKGVSFCPREKRPDYIEF
jgi:hypothetical protein